MQCPVEGGGFFGVPKAVSNMIKEQGRNRLHVHIAIWIDSMQQMLETLFTGYNADTHDSRSKDRNKNRARKQYQERWTVLQVQLLLVLSTKET